MGKEAEKRIVVPIKQVPDMDRVKFNKEEGRIDRSSADTEPNPFDLNALEEAVKFKEEFGGEIVAISMGPSQADSTLKEALARGADEAILLSDKFFGGADTWATAYTLSMGIKKLGNFDLILCGEKTVDGDTGQVGPEIAEILDIPHAAFVSEVLERNNDSIKVVSDAWGGSYVKKLEFPGVITVTKDVNVPRLPSLKDKMAARKAEIKLWGLDDFPEVEKDDVGIRGSPTSVNKIEIVPEPKREGKIFRDDISKSVDKLIGVLKEDGVLNEVRLD